MDFKKPAYFDIQVNGYAGVDFNADGMNAESLHAACEALARDGVCGILATIITDSVPAMCARLATLVELRERDELARRMIPGLHIEGPFLSPRDGFRGAHPLDAIRPADTDVARSLLDAGGGLVRLFTLAPEQDPGGHVTQMLRRAGVTVSAGHTDASLDQLQAACDAGLSLFTHLGNGCPRQTDRHDNIVQRAINLSIAGRLTPCFIADGVHVPFFALSNYLKACGTSDAVVVTDAMAAAGLGPGRYRLGRWEVDVGADLSAWAPDRSHLVGSAMSMRQADANLCGAVGLDEVTCQRLLSVNPRRAVGMGS